MLIDRDLFFGNPEIAGAQLSPNGKYISFMRPYQGIMNVWVKTIEQSFDDATLVTQSERPLYGYFWSFDSQYILYQKDTDGDENVNIYAVDPYRGTKDNAPEARNLTPHTDVRAQLLHVSQNLHSKILVGLNVRDKAWHDLYEINMESGETTLLFENKDRITGYDFDWDDNLRLLYQTEEDGTTLFLLLNTDGSSTEIYRTKVTETAYVVGWTKDNHACYLVSNVGELDKTTLHKVGLDPLTSEVIESDPEDKVDFGSLIMDRHNRSIIATSYTADKVKYYWQDQSWHEMYAYVQAQFPNREISFTSFTFDYKKALVSVGGDRYASETYYFDRDSKVLIHQYTSRPELKKVEAYLSPMQAISYQSSDGLEIPAYLTLPYGAADKNLPLVVLVHGGPKGPRDYWGYDAEVQFLANRGYAVLQPNFRASGGYGKSYLNAGDLQWGKLMQDDITYGVHHLVALGIADKDRVAIMGGSYGGYATLAGLAFTPDLYACGVDIVGPSNIFTLLASIPPYWEAGRAFLYGMVGDPNTEAGKALIQAASPLYSVEKINKPLLIIQGAKDPRVKQAESDQIVAALKEKGKKVAYLLAQDEGHGFAKPMNKKAMYAKIEAFLGEVLGGRSQAEMDREVAEALSILDQG